MIELISWLLIVSVPPITFLCFYLNIKKYLNKKQGRKRWAFFHPFWYFYHHIAMMEVGDRKFFGAWSKN